MLASLATPFWLPKGEVDLIVLHDYMVCKSSFAVSYDWPFRTPNLTVNFGIITKELFKQ